ncbi:MAG TPA: PAS domain S-box protein [Dokdonella sp.]
MRTTTEQRAALFQALFETAPDAMIVIDRSGHIVLANVQAERLFGYPNQGLYGLPIETLMPERLRASHGTHRSRFMANPRVRPMGAGFELVGMRRDGSEFPVEIGLSPVRDDEDPLYAASIRDISETQRARQALARARYDSFVGQVGRLALESRDYEAWLERLPEIIAEALGVEAVAVLLAGTQRSDLHVRGYRGVPAELLDQLPDLAGMPGWNTRMSSADHDGFTLLDFDARGLGELRTAAIESNFLDAAVLPLFDRYDSIGVLLAFAGGARAFDRDMMRFLQSVAHLLSAALQRNRSEEQLAHAQRLEAIGQLTGGVAHDFNNLLTVISGNLQLLEDEDSFGADRAAIIQSALRAVGSGAALTRKLLAFARRQRLSPRAIAPRAWLGELSLLLKRTLGETVVVRIECESHLPDVFADPGELDAALVNLALNARDAMPRGGELTIAAVEHDVAGDEEAAELARGRYIAISVADTGIGMAPEVLARALEPFFTTKGPGKGSGLGLSMVYGFAKQSGGAMTIESQLGYGTRVALQLPQAPAGRADTVLRERPLKSSGGETVLVVEDEPDVRGIAVAFLRSLGYSSLVASTAEEALGLLRNHARIELLFSDVVLGSGMTGVDLAHAARRLRPGLPVLLASGYEHAMLDGDAQDSLELLRKPYSRGDFAAAIRRVLDRA